MQDAVYTPALSPGFGGYCGYQDGSWPNASYILSHFPDAYHLFYTTGLGPAEGIDVEPGNAGWNDGFAAVPGWVKSRIAAGVQRPVIYLSASYASEMILLLAGNGLPRSTYRLFAAHWTGEPHICSSQDIPSGFAWQADATQHTGNVGGILYGYDLSLCADDFFAPTVAPTPITPAPKPPKPTPTPEEDPMEYMVEAAGPAVKAQALSRKKYPAVNPNEVYVIDPAQNLKYPVLGGQLPLYIAIMPPERVFLHGRAQPCANIAAVPSS